MDRITVCARRLGITPEFATPIANRDEAACKEMVDSITEAIHESPEACCPGNFTPQPDDDGPRFACTHVRTLWDAKTYLGLARAGAPADGAFPCECSGSGKYYSGGMVLNGHYTGTIGVCFRCSGKGWQTKADRKRNEYYDNHCRRIPAC